MCAQLTFTHAVRQPFGEKQRLMCRGDDECDLVKLTRVCKRAGAGFCSCVGVPRMAVRGVVSGVHPSTSHVVAYPPNLNTYIISVSS